MYNINEALQTLNYQVMFGNTGHQVWFTGWFQNGLLQVRLG